MTMFEVGKLSDETLDSFLAELEKVRPSVTTMKIKILLWFSFRIIYCYMHSKRKLDNEILTLHVLCYNINEKPLSEPCLAGCHLQ